jgi:hypothetical protein
MTTVAIDLLDELSLRWEACAAFVEDGDNLICAECGWLKDEHLPER